MNELLQTEQPYLLVERVFADKVSFTLTRILWAHLRKSYHEFDKITSHKLHCFNIWQPVSNSAQVQESYKEKDKLHN